MAMDAFIDTAWTDHADHPEAVAERLSASLPLITELGHVLPYARIVTHVFGEHLGRWSDGIALLGAMGGLPLAQTDPAAVSAVRRSIAALGHAAGDAQALATLNTEERILALATASSALAGRRAFPRATAAYAEALRLTDTDTGTEAPSSSAAVFRALAVGGNNLAAALEEHADRTAGDTESMLLAAESGLRYWKLAGTWLEEERAEYRLTHSRLQAGLALPAVESAMRCVAVCKAHDAPVFEQFFGYAALALAHRAAGQAVDFAAARAKAEALHAQLSDDERPWCAGDLARVQAPPRPADA